MKMQPATAPGLLIAILILMITHIHGDDGQGCPDGFFMSTGSSRCFKMFTDVRRTWSEANQKCKTEGLSMAHPSDSVAVELRKDIFDTYGTGSLTWLDARGTDVRSQIQHVHEWLKDTDVCLGLDVTASQLRNNPDSPYYAGICLSSKALTLCETGAVQPGTPPPHTTPGCISDSECQSKQFCMDKRCQNVCSQDACRQNEVCTVGVLGDFKTPICNCPLGFFLDTDQICKQSGCTEHIQCEDNKRCIEGNCENPCDLVKCGQGANCRVFNRRPQCLCPVLTQGNPLVRCEPTQG